MKATGGAFPDLPLGYLGIGSRVCQSRAHVAGYAGLMLLFVVAGLVIVGVMLAPDLVLKVKARNRDNEERTLNQLNQRLIRRIEKTQTIPAATNWSTMLLPFIGKDLDEVEKVFPGFATDSNIARVFLVDPGLTSGLLPYSQDVLGLTNSQTNLMGGYARVMLVANTKRSLTLPVTSGTPGSNAFYSLWNWVYDPTTKAPPSAFPGSWSGAGEFLHVQRLNLASLFFRVTMNRLIYGVGETNTAGNLVNSQTTYYFLRGSRLVLADTNGTLKRIHVVNRDISFDFGGTSLGGPLGRWRFVETSGAIATNSGSLGSSAQGLFTNGVTLNVAGPQAPTFSGYSSNNTAAQFDGANQYIAATNNLMNNFIGFTIAGWINPSSADSNNQDLFGQPDIAGFGFTTAGKVELYCDSDTKKLHYFYPYSAGAWHHLTGVGDGSDMYIYVDGVQVASRTYATSSYGSNNNPFYIGAKVLSSGNYFNGLIDEVLVYDRALSAAEIAQLYAGNIPQ